MSKHSIKMTFLIILVFGVFLHIEAQETTFTIILTGINSSSSRGRVEILRNNGQNGTVCNDGFNDLAAAVVCRQLGFPSDGAKADTNGTFGPGTGLILLDDVTCVGNEQHLQFCTSSNWGEHNCDHSEDVGVICDTSSVPATGPPSTTKATATVQPSNCTSPSTTIRLKGPTNMNGIGFVEVFRNGAWGSVCDDNWNVQNAKVVCRMLCYDPNIAQPGTPNIDNIKDQVSQNIVLDDVNCAGTETDIAQCPQAPLGNHNCDASNGEFASVTCVKLQNTQPKAPIPELECSDDGKFYARFSRQQDPNLEPKHLTIFYPYTGSCETDYAVTTDTVSFVIPFGGCGTKRTGNNTHLFFTNTIKYNYTRFENQIVRVNTYKIEITCINERAIDSINEGVTPMTESVTQKADGKFTIFMTLFNDSFNTALTAPIQLTLGEWLNVALTLEAIDPNLKLIVPNCKATPTNDPNDPTAYDLFNNNNCEKDPTLGFFPWNNTVYGFRYQTFKFIQYANVVLQCDAFVCLLSEKSAECDRTCDQGNSTSTGSNRRKRDVFARQTYRVTSQPISFRGTGNDVVIDRGDGWEVKVSANQSTTVAMTTGTVQTTIPSTASVPTTTTRPTSLTSWQYSSTSSTIIKVTSVSPTSSKTVATTKSTLLPIATTFTAQPTTKRGSELKSPTTSSLQTSKISTLSKSTLQQTLTKAPTSTSSMQRGSTEQPSTENQNIFRPEGPYFGGIGSYLDIRSKASFIVFHSKLICSLAVIASFYCIL